MIWLDIQYVGDKASQVTEAHLATSFEEEGVSLSTGVEIKRQLPWQNQSLSQFAQRTPLLPSSQCDRVSYNEGCVRMLAAMAAVVVGLTPAHAARPRTGDGTVLLY